MKSWKVATLLLTRMKEWDLYAHPEKCDFFNTHIEYLGLGIHDKGLYITDATKETIQSWEIPRPNMRNKKQNRKPNADGKTAIRTFLGMVSFFRKFIPRLSERAYPISKLLDPSYTFSDWGHEQDWAFDDLKKALLSSECLMLPDTSTKFVLYPDASEVGVGAVLMQEDPETRLLRPCAYMSSKLSKVQKDRGAYETELWAMVKALMTWKHYLAGTEVEVRSDHQPLKWFQSQSKLSGKLMRWLDFLSEFDLTLVHVPREKNTAADALSKNPIFYHPILEEHQYESSTPIEDCLKLICDGKYAAVLTRSAQIVSQQRAKTTNVPALKNILKSTWLDAIRAAYATDEFVQKQIRRSEKGLSTNYSYDGTKVKTLYRKDNFFGKRIFVPVNAMVKNPNNTSSEISLRKLFLLEFHESPISGGHQGIRRTLSLLQRNFWWPDMRREVIIHVNSCPKCQRTKAFHLKPFGKYVGWKPPIRRWSSISMDFIVALPLTLNGYDAILVVMDSTSRRIHLLPVNMNITAEETAKLVFDNIVRHHGLSHTILHDNDPRFIAKIWKKIWELTGTHLYFTPSYHPIANSANERSHRVIEDSLRSYVMDYEKWDEHIAPAEFAINNHENIDTGRTPFELDTGQHPLNPVTVQMSDLVKNKDIPGVLADWQASVKNAVVKYSEAQVRRLDILNKNRVVPNFDAGSKVLLSSKYIKWPGSDLMGEHLKPRWIGEFEVEKFSKNKQSVTIKLRGTHKFHPVIPVNRVKEYIYDESEMRRHLQPPMPIDIDDEKEFEVSKILSHRYNKRKRIQEYLIEFKGYGPEYNQWRPINELRETCRDMLEKYDLDLST